MTLSNNTKRALLAATLVAVLFSGVNYYFELHLFHGFDKQVFSVTALAMILLARFIRTAFTPRRTRLSWTQFGFIALSVSAACLATLWDDYRRADTWDPWKLAWLVLPLWILLFVGYRWRFLLKKQEEGYFLADDYAINPGAYIFGPKRSLVLWMALGITIVIAIACAKVYLRGV